MEAKTSAHAIIHGRVQGVCYRAETKYEADRLKVCGWVKNKRDGTVEAYFSGDKGAVEAIIEWCKEGPPYARVYKIDVKWEEYKDKFKSFEIVY
ncbi:MAG: acylphosphatase [Desulfobacterales bacterium]|nr:acylphosphatase [Desulfobacterales bacterium]MBF0395975.1 acylphosphatase [Desulfobacterales bacterium]